MRGPVRAPRPPPPPRLAPLAALLALLALPFLIAWADAFDTSQCIAPLGMQSGAIPDHDLSASSSYESGNVGPQHGRVRTESQGGAWCPKLQITTSPNEWLQVELHSVHVITAVETQGRFGNGQGQEYAEAYMLEYYRPRLDKWVRYRDENGQEVLKGNENTYLEAKRDLNPPIRASRIRFLPYSFHRRTVCMRVELYGCQWNEGVVCYSMPQGDKRGAWEFYDNTYDGHWDGDALHRGLGQLTDGRVGPDNFKMGYHEQDRGLGWVGWKNESRDGQPIEIKFEFDKVREFKAVHIYCNNQFMKDVQVFAEAQVLFSVGGRHFNGQPITYTTLEDRIFESSRNVSIKLHHRVGRFVKLRLHFAAKWMLVSEISFDSSVAHGNFTTEPAETGDTPVQSDVYVEKDKDHTRQQTKTPVPSAEEDDSTYMAVIMGVLIAVILLLAAVIFVIVSRHRKRKCFASPLNSKSALPTSHAALSASEKGGGSSAGTLGTLGGAYGVREVGAGLVDGYGHVHGAPPANGPSLGGDMDHLLEGKLDDYQEPYQALKYAPYYSYSTVVMELGDQLSKSATTPSDTTYDYAVPESGGGIPLLSPEAALPLPSSRASDKGSLFSKSSSCNGSRSDDAKSRTSPAHHQQDVLRSLKRRLQTAVPEFPQHRLKLLARLGDGAFGTLYVAEADGIPEYGTTVSVGKRLVAVKFLNQGAGEKEKMDFHKDVRLLSALEDPRLARVLGMCSRGEPLCVALEYLPNGDLHRFLRERAPHLDHLGMEHHLEDDQVVSFNTLLYMASQIASGMRYLETLNFVHRDLAARNCLVGDNFEIKISDFGTDNELYAADYYTFGESVQLPVRWMAWESVFLGKYTTKSDVWAFAVTLWEMLHYCSAAPYPELDNPGVVDNLSHLRPGEDPQLFEPLCMPPLPAGARDVFDLMCECWRRGEAERPSFREIHLFLQRKNLGYAPVLT
ncbi:discoidin domain-containing receptor 2-like isoform X2 [Thrips palmi]|uniref:Discoidin domain-containing receptor 2-like isoform X2 n=1 Tax=Thrips palmi TaxID=161013 RepID=A0A6P8Y799_THRPL|nr:discoidin domain-containing receptor 2-like isoform X2 [Thrips palmi]